MKQQLTKLALSTAAFAVSAAIYNNILKAQAMPTAKAQEIFESGPYRRDGASNTVGICMSGVTDTIFGQNAYDYCWNYKFIGSWIP
jgi:hypothetical protein